MAREIDKKFIQKISGKEFILYAGLVELGHQAGLEKIEIELLQIPSDDNNMTAIVKAVITAKDKVFEDIGDASPSSVGNMIRPHIIRMASTRAKARALRDLTNVGMTALEELGGEDEKPKNVDAGLASEKQISFMVNLVKQKKYGVDNITKHMKEKYNKNSSKELSSKEASAIIKMLNEYKAEEEK